MIWRSILDTFQLGNVEPDKRLLYLNVFHGYGLKFPSTYQPIPNSGRTSIRLFHQLRGVTHRIWCSDDHTFLEPVDAYNLVDLWHRNHSPEYKLSEIRDIPSLGEVTKEVVLEARTVEVLSRLILKNSRIYSITQRLIYKDDAIEFMFIDPQITYEEANAIAQKISFTQNNNSKLRSSTKRLSCCSCLCRLFVLFVLVLVVLLVVVHNYFFSLDVYLNHVSGELGEYSVWVEKFVVIARECGLLMMDYGGVLKDYAVKMARDFIPNKLIL